MATRLGNVLYWAACLAAAGWAIVICFATASMKPPDWTFFWVMGVAPAIGIWLIGRALRYVLAAR